LKLAKWWGAVMAAVLCLTAGTVVAADRAQMLKQASEKLEAFLVESQAGVTGDNVGTFKKAGLSYQPSLVVPVEGVDGCKDKEQLGMLLGMYAFDANYALPFGRKQEFVAANGLREDIPDRLNLRGNFKFKIFTPDEVKKILDNPDDPASRDLYVNKVSANIHDMSEASKSDLKNLDLFVNFVYGVVLQSLYVSCHLARAAGPGEKLVALFNQQAARLDKFDQALLACAGDPELDALVGRAQRQRVIKPIAKILKSNKGNLAEADLAKILSLIEPERSKVTSKCK
jgi:hypothetical protein